MKLKIQLFFILLGFVNTAAWSGQLRNWTLDNFDDFVTGEFDNTEISEAGDIHLTYPINELANLDVVQAWSLLGVGDNLFVGTASPAQLLCYHVNQAKLDTLCAFSGGGIFALTEFNHQAYAVLSPQGYILKSEGSSVDTIQVKDSLIIWDICVLDYDKIALATGNQGMIYIVNSQGTITDSIETFDEAVTKLNYHRDSLYVGTSGQGYFGVVDINKKTMFVIHDPPGDEVNEIFIGSDRIFYTSISGSINVAGLGAVSTMIDTDYGFESSLSEMSSNLYYYQNGMTQFIWQTPEPPITKIDQLADGRIAVFGSPEGTIYALDLENYIMSVIFKEISLVADCCSHRNGDIILLTLNPPLLYSLDNQIADQGYYISPVLKTDINSVLGKFYWIGSGILTFQARVGNTSEPDDQYWSEWGDQYSSNPIDFNLPPSNYWQYQVKFTKSSDSSSLYKTELIYYLSSNQAPVIQNITIYAPGVGHSKVMNLGISTNMFTEEMREWCSISGWPIPENPVELPYKWQGIFWEGRDINGDSLVYEVWMKRDNWREWLKLTDNLKINAFAFNDLYFENGRYQIKIIASDSISNPGIDYLEDSLISEYFWVDNTPPQFKEFTHNQDVLEFLVEDELSRIIECYYSSDGIQWSRLIPVDLVMDSPREKFQVKLSDDYRMIRFYAVDGSQNIRYHYWYIP